jgi:hypothetical protein
MKPAPAADAALTTALMAQLFATDAAEKAATRRPCDSPCEVHFGADAAAGDRGDGGAAGTAGAPVASLPLDALAVSQGGSWSLSQYAWHGQELVRGTHRERGCATGASLRALARRSAAGRL